MKNIELFGEKSVDLPIKDSISKRCVVCHKEYIFVSFGTCVYIVKLNENRMEIFQTYKLPVSANHGFIIHIEYIIASNELITFIESGSILTSKVNDGILSEFECIGSTDSKPLYVSYNYEQSKFVLYTESQRILLMSSLFAEIVYVDANPTDLGEGQNISLGWGSKDTQFLGKGKRSVVAMQEPLTTIQSEFKECVETDPILERTTHVSIAWRMDGEYFAVSAHDPVNECRTIRIWNKQGILHSTVEKTVNLLPHLVWSPLGNWLATVQFEAKESSKEFPNYSFRTVLFERNGLKRHHFDINSSDDSSLAICQIFQLVWNKDSDVLAIICQKRDISNKLSPKYCTSIRMFKISNYFWYLKSEISLSVEDCSFSNPFALWQYDTRLSKNSQFFSLVVSHGVKLFNFDLRFSYHRSSTDSTVVVADGEYLMASRLDESLIPPPYSRCCAKLSFIPSCFTIITNQSSSIIAISPCGKIFEIVSFDFMAKSMCEPRNVQSASSNLIVITNKTSESLSIEDSSRFRMCCASNEFLLFAVFYDHSASADILCEIVLDKSPEGTYSGTITKTIRPPSSISKITSSSDGSHVLLEMVDSKFITFSSIHGISSIIFSQCYNLPGSISQQLNLLNPNEPSHSKPSIMRICRDGFLWFGSNKLLDLCDSFLITEKFLIISRKTSRLICVPISKIIEYPLEAEGNTFQTFLQTFPEREIECEATIVSGTFHSQSYLASIYLQMPRGNLECIHPRPLVLDVIRQCIVDGKYKIALGIVRKHRIDPNILFQLPRKIHSDFCLSKLVYHLECDESVCYLLSHLRPQNVVGTIYNKYFEDLSDVSETPLENSEILQICSEVRMACRTLNEQKFSKSILLTYLREPGENSVENCLMDLLNISKKYQWSLERIQSSLQFLLRYVDSVEVLYRKALATYDFQLTVLVAQIANKDPLDYEPFLKSFAQVEPLLYRHFLIDSHLELYSRALNKILQVPSKFQECLEFIKKHGFYQTSIKFLLEQNRLEDFKITCEAFGEHLSSKKLLHEAAIYFIRASNFQRALEMAREAGDISQIDCILSQSALSFLPQHAKELCARLEKQSKFSDCARICEVYLKDLPKAFDFFVRCHDWVNALRLQISLDCSSNENNQLYSQKLTEDLTFRCSMVNESVGRFIKQWTSLVERLKIVRKEKEEWMKFSETVGLNLADCCSESDADTFASSMSGSVLSSSSQRSSMSASSSMSKRSKAKKERNKFLNLKEGGTYEEFALLHKLGQLVETIKTDFLSDAETLRRSLLMLNLDKCAEEHELTLRSLKSIITEDHPQVWIPTLYLGPVRKQETLPVVLQNLTTPLISVPTIPEWPLFISL